MGDSKEPASAKIAPELSDTQRMMYAFGDSRRPKVKDETDDNDKNEDAKVDDNKDEDDKEDENE